MQQVLEQLEKLKMLARQESHGRIDIDLMLDHTRIIYGYLLEKRDNVIIENHHVTAAQVEDADPSEMQLTLHETAEEYIQPLGELPEVATASDRPIAEADIEAPPFSDRDIRKHIGINDKYLFISELFENDRDAYERALDQINRCTFCREATDWLTQQARGRYNWDRESDAVQSFYGIVSHFFASR